ncbi:MAG TPA: FAD-dependent oxidoreductase [Clostridia bacterium]|nr:FAD-dependent oxidoreductase [Clostridia bacterium]
MSSYIVTRDYPRREEYDVIVVGGGTAGSIAAIAAAREGAKILLIEKYGFLGGTATASQVTPMMNVKIEGNPASSIDRKIRKRMIELGFGAKSPGGNDGWFNPEMLKFILEEMVLEQGGEILYDTQFVDAIVLENEIRGIIVHNREGTKVIEGKIFIDATGDAEVAHSAGAPCFVGSEKSGKNQAVSLRFMVGNVDLKRLQTFLKELGQEWGLNYPLIEMAMIWDKGFALEKVFKKALEEGAIEYDDGRYFQAFSVPGMPGVMSFNCPEIPDVYNSLDGAKITYSYIKGRKMIKRLHNFLRKYVAGFEDSFILSVAPMIGIRESRRIKGEYVLTIEDYNNRSKFDDEIAKTAYPVDIHGEEEGEEVIPLRPGEYFEIPFRALIPQNIHNLLVVGRAISSTFTMQSSIRIQPTCRATGEAAGIAAAYAVKNNIGVRDVDGKIIREIMRNYGADL